MNTGSERGQGAPAGYFVVVSPDSQVDASFDIRGLLARLWRGRVWIGAATAVFVAVAILHAVFGTRVYKSEAIVVVRSEDMQGPLGLLGGQLGGLASLAGIQLNKGSSREEYLAHLKSRSLARHFIESGNLVPVLYSSRWDEVSKSFRGEAPTLGDAVDYFVEDVRTIRQDAKTGLVTLSIEWRDPEVAAKWTNGYIALANETLRSRSLARARESIAYLNDELGRTTLEPVRQSIYRLMEGRINEVMFANVEPEFAFQFVDRAEAAEPRKFIRPRPALEVALGLFLGLFIGGMLALWRTQESRPTS